MTTATNESTESVRRSLCDFLLVIALEEEFKHLLTTLRITYEPFPSLGIQCYRFRLPAPRNGYAEGVATFIGEMGINEANLVTSKLLPDLNPGLIVSIGIAGLVSDAVRLGDVVVATDSDNYLHRSKIGQKLGGMLNLDDISFGGKSLPTTDSYCSVVQNLPYTDPNVSENWLAASRDQLANGLDSAVVDKLRELTLIAGDASIHVGPVACGPWVGAARKFKEVLAKCNRNYLSMDMESFGVLQAARSHSLETQTLVIRGISDPADERKRELDQIRGGFLREWSMANALRLFAALIQKVELKSYTLRDPATLDIPPESLKDKGNKIHEVVVSQYLKRPYNDSSYVRKHSADTYSDLFSRFSEFEPLKDGDQFLATLTEVALSSNTSIPLLIEGTAGTGKTSLLSILYWYLLDRASDTDLLPLLIDLHRYNRAKRQRSLNVGSSDQAVTAFAKHLRPLQEFIYENPDYPILVIIDGYDEFARFKDVLLNHLFTLLNKARHWKIIGSREGRDALSREVTEDLPKVSVILRPMRTDDLGFDSFLEVFITIAASENVEALKQSVSTILTTCRLRYVDFFMLSLALDYCKSTRPNESHLLSTLLEDYCRRYFRQRLSDEADQKKLFDRAAELAFYHEVGKEKSLQEEESVLWELSRQHPRISDYLTARHMTAEFLKADGAKAKVLKKLPPYVYPHRINRFAKELLNRDEATQYRFVRALENILKQTGVHPYAKAQACYLAGRLEDHQARETARAALNRFRIWSREQRLNERHSIGKAELLLIRTLYISLAYLGEEEAQEEYVEDMIANREMDMFNRGFHLEYYEDQKYTPSEALTSTDQLRPCPRTFDQLISNLNSNPANPISEIELFTICSLAQHRHAVGKLENDDRIRIMELGKLLLQRHSIRSGLLRTYVNMVLKHIKHENFHISRIFHDYYKIKTTKRSGWVNRGIQDGESVADHSYGAYLLALFLLPDEWPRDPTYSKHKIMNMLLIHDLAEAITGDVLPTQSNEESKRREREVFEELALLGTYEGLARMREIGALWEEFEGRQTLNAQVAKDIDKLENLVQLWIYAKEGKSILDFDAWREELLDSIKTTPGELALKKLLATYESEK